MNYGRHIALLVVCSGWPGLHSSTLAFQNPSGTQTSPSVQQLRNPLNDLLGQAQAALDRGDYAAAISLIQEFVAEKPDVAYAHFQLGYAYTALRRVEEARAEYERAIALDPQMAEAQLNLGILLLAKDPASAVAPLSKAARLLPSASRPRYLLGLAEEGAGNRTAAAESFEAAIRLDPKDVASLVHLGRLYLGEARPADAEGEFRAALAVQPDSREALLGWAASLEAQNKPEAQEAYRRYLAIEPSDRAARGRLIHILVEQQQFDLALAELDKAEAGHTASVDELKLRAEIEIGQKKLDPSVLTLKRALALAPSDASLHGTLGRIYLEKRDFADAERELKTALQLEPSRLAYWKDLSTTYYLSGNYTATLQTLDIIAKSETPGPGPWFMRALCYDKLMQARPALEAYRKFLALDDNKNPDQVWQAKQRIHVLEKTADKQK